MKGRSDKGGKRISETKEVTTVVNAAASLIGDGQSRRSRSRLDLLAIGSIIRERYQNGSFINQSKSNVHQPNSYLEHIILKRKVREALPELLRALLDRLLALEERFARVVEVDHLPRIADAA